jgi:hypothetical protein
MLLNVELMMRLDKIYSAKKMAEHAQRYTYKQPWYTHVQYCCSALFILYNVMYTTVICSKS